jgi:hypothetical protein
LRRKDSVISNIDAPLRRFPCGAFVGFQSCEPLDLRIVGFGHVRINYVHVEIARAALRVARHCNFSTGVRATQPYRRINEAVVRHVN